MAKPGPAKGTRPAGRQKGTPNKITATLKEAILLAAEEAGGEGKLVGYLKTQAQNNPGPFLALLGKVLPTQVSQDPDNPIRHIHEVIEREIVRPTMSNENRSEAVH